MIILPPLEDKVIALKMLKKRVGQLDEQVEEQNDLSHSFDEEDQDVNCIDNIASAGRQTGCTFLPLKDLSGSHAKTICDVAAQSTWKS